MLKDLLLFERNKKKIALFVKHYDYMFSDLLCAGETLDEKNIKIEAIRGNVVIDNRYATTEHFLLSIKFKNHIFRAVIPNDYMEDPNEDKIMKLIHGEMFLINKHVANRKENNDFCMILRKAKQLPKEKFDKLISILSNGSINERHVHHVYVDLMKNEEKINSNLSYELI